MKDLVLTNIYLETSLFNILVNSVVVITFIMASTQLQNIVSFLSKEEQQNKLGKNLIDSNEHTNFIRWIINNSTNNGKEDINIQKQRTTELMNLLLTKYGSNNKMLWHKKRRNRILKDVFVCCLFSYHLNINQQQT